jgi:hypothetical protein
MRHYGRAFDWIDFYSTERPIADRGEGITYVLGKWGAESGGLLYGQGPWADQFKNLVRSTPAAAFTGLKRLTDPRKIKALVAWGLANFVAATYVYANYRQYLPETQ